MYAIIRNITIADLFETMICLVYQLVEKDM